LDKPLKKILLVNAVLTNNGDAAITLALYNRLVESGFEVTIATHHFNKIKENYPGLVLISDVGSGFFLRKLPFLKKHVKPVLYALKGKFRSSQAVIGVPGGYMNSYYDFSQLLKMFVHAASKNKLVGVYANSFGPFSKKDLLALEHSSGVFSALMARDERSMELLRNTKLNPGTFFKSNDAAFLLPQIRGVHKEKRVAISVREWKKDKRSMKAYVKLVSGISHYLLERGYAIEFLSTCQGIKDYHNDAKVAEMIAAQLTYSDKSLVHVDKEYYTLDELRTKLTEYDFVVGTRLHMCLLALKSGVPAFNISYEFKGKEAYSYLGFGEFSVDFNEKEEHAIHFLSQFLTRKEDVRSQIPKLMEKQLLDAEIGFSKFVELISK